MKKPISNNYGLHVNDNILIGANILISALYEQELFFMLPNTFSNRTVPLLVQRSAPPISHFHFKETNFIFGFLSIYMYIMRCQLAIQLNNQFLLLHLQVLIRSQIFCHMHVTSQTWRNMPRKFKPVKTKQRQEGGHKLIN